MEMFAKHRTVKPSHTDVTPSSARSCRTPYIACVKGAVPRFCAGDYLHLSSQFYSFENSRARNVISSVSPLSGLKAVRALLCCWCQSVLIPFTKCTRNNEGAEEMIINARLCIHIAHSKISAN